MNHPIQKILKDSIEACDRAIKIHEVAVKSFERAMAVHREQLVEWQAVRRQLREELEQLTPAESTEAFRRSSQILKAIKKDDQ